MSVKKILYAYNFNAQDLSHFLMGSLMDMQQIGLSEVIFLQLAPFNGWIQALSKHDIKANILVEQKLLLSRILSVAEQAKVSIIVVHLDRKRPKGVRRSLIKKLIQKSSIPILFINNRGLGQKAIKKALFEHVIIATDWSPAADNALNHVLIFGKIIKELEIVKVSSAKLTVKDIRELQENLTKTRKMCLDRGIDAEAHVYAGKTTEEIMAAAKDYKGSLIVLGSDSKKNVNTLFTNNKPCAVTAKADIPVLVVPSAVTI